VHAALLGSAMNNDGYHMTAPDPQVRGIKRLMKLALQDAQCTPERIDHLNLHATGTPL